MTNKVLYSSPKSKANAANKNSNVAATKSNANALMKAGRYVEAIIEYSDAIASQSSNPILYANRSLAFLKLSQYFFAIKDAEKAIQLVPDWSKGYYRKGQAEYGAESYHLAVSTFKLGLKMCPGDAILAKACDDAKKREREFVKMWRYTKLRYTMLFGLICAILVLGDMVAHPYESILREPWLRPLYVALSGLLGYFVAFLVYSFQQATKQSLLDPPLELLQPPSSTTPKRTPRIIKSEKRMPRFKTKLY